jgi:mxaA protein
MKTYTDFILASLLLLAEAIAFLFSSIMLIGSYDAQAQESDARIAAIVNPAQSNGIHVGDVMARKVVIETSPPYQISRNALPMKGVSRNGIELADIQVATHQRGKKTLYEIALRYQVFASASVPTVMQLPAEEFALTGGPKALAIQLPTWRFWFSPLVVADITTAKDNLQPQYRPSLIDTSAHRSRLAVFIGLLVVGLLGLVYVNADRRWLPFMGGAFAQAHRKLKRLPRNAAQEKQALLALHQAFNQMYGSNLFAQDISQFVAAHPGFAKVKADIESFFEQSNRVLFGHAQQDSAQFIRHLTALSKRLRDCERGVA